MVGFFKDCPKNSWTEKGQCVEAKRFVEKCYKDLDAMEKMAEQLHSTNYGKMFNK